MPVMVARDLPAELALPLATGEPWWYWLGGRPSLDLTNTCRERWRRQVETLVTPEDLSLWMVRAGLAGEPMTVPRSVLRSARDLREAIDAGVRAVVAGMAAPADAIALIDDWLVHAGARPRLTVGPGGVPLLGERAAADSPRRVLGMIALDAAAMLGTAEERARVRICGSATCSARFYDRSPAGRRRWCSMRACGNAEKARRHRERLRHLDHPPERLPA
jgi:predicted RNA-binding Zn ribbon-like protein